MKFKKHILLNGFLIMAILGGCSNNAPIERIEQVKQVNVVTIERTYQKESVIYTGFVSATVILPVLTEKSGQIETIHVKEGDRISAGDVMVTANAPDTTAFNLLSPIEGVVLDVMMNEEDLINTQTPVMLIRDEPLIISVGVTGEDFLKIKNESVDKVDVMINGIVKQGFIYQMREVPDENTRLYTVTIKIKEDKSLLIGDMARVTFSLSGVNGIWLPISRILNDGEDYVLIVNSENRVERRNLKRLSLNNDLVRIEGLKAGERIITVGYSNVKEGQVVNAREALDDKVD